ncbi:hypothetical protein UQ64_21435 [Paenibacillus etheri]|uniref:Uncharacterized protein n=1 Tax=Paenibacillus etheri TaxID=1306852 RepID=A0A0W1AVB2_9BACL|nr:hypothetical protein [Paenibacillus etheri]KTD85204.1 hypothetical protein UQ64_21435 [Paenibacillus etheri]
MNAQDLNVHEEERIGDDSYHQRAHTTHVENADERAQGKISRRYAGYQVQPRKTVSLLKGRQWTVSYEEGLQKVYYAENLIANLYAMADWFSPSEIEA